MKMKVDISGAEWRKKIYINNCQDIAYENSDFQQIKKNFDEMCG